MIGSTQFNFIWIFVEKLLRVLVSAVVLPLVARHLGPETYGSLAVSIGIVSIAIAMANMGADHIHVSEFARRDGADRETFLGSALFVRVFWSLVCLVLFWVAVSWLSVSHRDVLLILSAGVPISAAAILAGEIQGRGAFGTFSILSCVSIGFGALLRIAGILYGASLEFFAVVFVAETAFLALLLFGWHLSANANSLFGLGISRSYAVSYFKMCIPTAVSATLAVLYLRFELFMIDALIGKSAAGIWSAALMFIAPWSMVAAAILPVANRRLAISIGEDVDYKRRLTKLLRWMIALAAAAAIFNCAVAAVLAPLLLGPEFNAVAPIVFIMSLSIFPLFSGAVQDLWIAHQRNTGTVLRKVLVGLPVSATLYYLTVPNFGLRGAAFSMVLSYFITAILLNIMFDKQFFRIQLRALGFSNV